MCIMSNVDMSQVDRRGPSDRPVREGEKCLQRGATYALSSIVNFNLRARACVRGARLFVGADSGCWQSLDEVIRKSGDGGVRDRDVKMRCSGSPYLVVVEDGRLTVSRREPDRAGSDDSRKWWTGLWWPGL